MVPSSISSINFLKAISKSLRINESEGINKRIEPQESRFALRFKAAISSMQEAYRYRPDKPGKRHQRD